MIGLLNRVKRICSDEAKFNKHLNDIKYYLCKLNSYPEYFVNKIFKQFKYNKKEKEKKKDVSYTYLKI